MHQILEHWNKCTAQLCGYRQPGRHADVVRYMLDFTVDPDV